MQNADQVCLVTGASRGIGRAVCQVLARECAIVVAAARSADGIRKTADDITASGGRAEAIPVDITDRAAVSALVSRVIERYGRIDALVNAAGLMPMAAAVVDFDDDLFDELFGVNMTGNYIVTKAVLPHMIARRFGRVISFSSISATKTYPNFAAYAAAKNALIAFNSALSQEVAADGITVNTILPGFTETEEMHRIWGEIAANAGTTIEEVMRPIFEDLVPIHRWVQPQEVGELVSFLVSRRADAISGQKLTIDGGYEAHV